MRKTFSIILILSAALFLPAFGHGKVGVGVNLGRIEIDELLRPGDIYFLPSFSVINTGDEAANYEIAVIYHEGQSEIRPPSDWFQFTPSFFALDPGEIQLIEIKLQLPPDARPGKYFAYLEAHPISAQIPGGATIGIAAATKLYFQVAQASFLQGLWYRMLALGRENQPWPAVAGLVLVLAFILVLLKRFIAVKLTLTRKQ